MKKIRIISGFFFLLLGGILFVAPLVGQSNEVIDSILADDVILYKNGTYLVLTAAGRVDDSAAPAEAYEALEDLKKEWRVSLPGKDVPMTLGDFSYLVMRAFSIKGGLFFRIFPGPRYAAREMKFLGFVKDGPSPYRKISGEEAIGILGRTLEWMEERS
jgi:hypothetical protein